jgi:glucokinase
MYLIGDIGGTKTLLAIVEPTDNNHRFLNVQRFASSDYSTFAELLQTFVRVIGSPPITACCIGVAGPVINGQCHTTNLPWQLDSKTIAEQLKAPHVWLLNDLEAIAWGLLALDDSHLVELNPDASTSFGMKAVVAPGTGLGEALLPWDGENYFVAASEGGHADFAPTDARQIELLQYLLAKYPDHVSYERLLTGAGLINIYQFLKNANPAAVREETEKNMLVNDPAAVISTAAMAGTDPLCVETLHLFCRIFGAETSNLALKALAYGGVYLAGGIPPKILPFLQQSEFLQSFLAKGRYRNLLKKISIKVCTHSEVGLLGALSFACKQSTKCS